MNIFSSPDNKLPAASIIKLSFINPKLTWKYTCMDLTHILLLTHPYLLNTKQVGRVEVSKLKLLVLLFTNNHEQCGSMHPWCSITHIPHHSSFTFTAFRLSFAHSHHCNNLERVKNNWTTVKSLFVPKIRYLSCSSESKFISGNESDQHHFCSSRVLGVSLNFFFLYKRRISVFYLF